MCTGIARDAAPSLHPTAITDDTSRTAMSFMAGQTVMNLADRLVREALNANVPLEDVAEAAVMAAWAVFRKSAGNGPGHPAR